MKNQNESNYFQVIWVGIGSLSSFGLSIISTVILSRYFDKAEYGTYRQIIYVYQMLLVIFSAGLPAVFSYYLPRFPLTEGKEIVFKISKMLLFFGFLFSLFLFCFSDLIAKLLNNSDLAIGLKYFSPIPMLLLPTLGLEGIFSTYKKTIFIAIYNTLTRLLMLIFIVLPVVLLNGTYLYAIYGWLAVSLISFVIAYYFKGIPFKGVNNNNKTTLTFKEILNYSIPILFASAASIAIRSADQFYISRYFGPEVFSEFANGFIELPFVEMIIGGSAVVLMPIFSKAFYENGNLNEVIIPWKNAIYKSALIIYPLVVFFIAYASNIMVFLYSSKYSMSGEYFRINLFLNFFNILLFSPLFFAIGKARLYSYIHVIIAIAVWLIYYLVILIFNDPIAIAICSTIMNILKIIFFIFLAAKILKVNFTDLFPLKILIKIIFHSVTIVLIVKIILIHLIDYYSMSLQLMISSIVYMILLLLTAPFMKINYLSVFYPIIEKIKRNRL